MEGIAVQDIAMKGTVVGFFAMLVRFPVEISILTSYSCQVVRFLTYIKFNKFNLISINDVRIKVVQKNYIREISRYYEGLTLETSALKLFTVTNLRLS